MSRFQKATRKQLKLRMAICGPTGAGKTMTALKIASALGSRIAVIDTENRSASVYVGRPGVPDFDVLELETLAPRNYVEAISDAEKEGFDVVIIDSLSHAWQSKDGALAMADKAAKRSQSGNSYTAWRDVTPEHDALVDKLLRCKAHLITTMRSKMEYVLEENDRGKKTPRKVGMAPIQRSGMEYEFHVTVDMDVDHNMMVSKTRCDVIDGLVLNRPGREFGEKLLQWLSEGAPEAQEAPASNPLAEAAGAAQTSSAKLAASQRAGQTTTSSTSATPSTTTPEISEPRSIEWWQSQHNDLCDRAFQKAGIVCGPLDAAGLHVPSMEPPKFSAQAKKYAGLAFDDEKVPAGYLREVIWSADNFGTQKPDVRLWVSYLVSRHEIRKLAAAAIAAEQAEAERALAAANSQAVAS